MFNLFFIITQQFLNDVVGYPFTTKREFRTVKIDDPTQDRYGFASSYRTDRCFCGFKHNHLRLQSKSPFLSGWVIAPRTFSFIFLLSFSRDFRRSFTYCLFVCLFAGQGL